MGRRGLLLVVAIVGLTASPAWSQDFSGVSKDGTFTIDGNGQYESPPENAEIWASISSRADNLRDAQTDVAAKMAKGDAALEGLRAKGLVIEQKTYGVSQREQNPPKDSKEPPKLVWEADGDYHLKVTPLNEISAIITGLVDAGFEIGSVRFAVKDLRAAENEARQDAARDARDKAKAYADALGVKLGPIVSLADPPAAGVGYSVGEAAMPMRRMAPIAPRITIDVPPKLTFNASVRVVWRIDVGSK
jgi:uncharacterized protein